MNLTDGEIERLISEDVPYFDLTSHVLGLSGKQGQMSFFAREDALLCGTEEAARIFRHFNIEVVMQRSSGTRIRAGEVFLIGSGNAENLHSAWKICQNIVDRCSGIATATARMCTLVKAANPSAEVLTTRKIFPGMKKLFVKSIVCGGGLPHRLGLSETVLVFEQHMNFLGGLDGLIAKIPEIKRMICEKKLIVETDNRADAIRLIQCGADGIQFDKMSIAETEAAVRQIREIHPQAVILSAGGITENTAFEYAAAGVNAVVTTSLYNAPPIDVGVTIECSDARV